MELIELKQKCKSRFWIVKTVRRILFRFMAPYFEPILEDQKNFYKIAGDTQNRLSDAEKALGETQSRLFNAEKALGDTQNRLSDTEKALGETQNRLSDTEKALADTQSRLSDVEKVTAVDAGEAKKSIRLGQNTYTFFGLSKEDPYFNGICDDFEADSLNIFKELVQADAVCIDIGANIGVKSLFLADLASKGTVVSVEAGPAVADVLRQNIEINGKKNIILVNKAIGDKTDKISFMENTCWGHASTYEEGAIEMPMITLPLLAEELKLPKVDFIKIDVEGFEPKILRSSLDFINRNNTVVFFEFNSFCLLVWGNENPRVFLEWIMENFKAVYYVNQGGGGIKLSKLSLSNPDTIRFFLHTNMVFQGCCSDLVVTNNSVMENKIDSLIG